MCCNVSLALVGCDVEWMRDHSTCLQNKQDLSTQNNGMRQLHHRAVIRAKYLMY